MCLEWSIKEALPITATQLLVFLNYCVEFLYSQYFKRAEDKYAWLRDDEFARQAIAGVNPVSIERLQIFPPVSKLDSQVHGPQESALKEEHIVGQLNGMTIQQVEF